MCYVRVGSLGNCLFWCISTFFHVSFLLLSFSQPSRGAECAPDSSAHVGGIRFLVAFMNISKCFVFDPRPVVGFMRRLTGGRSVWCTCYVQVIRQ